MISKAFYNDRLNIMLKKSLFKKKKILILKYLPKNTWFKNKYNNVKDVGNITPSSELIWLRYKSNSVKDVGNLKKTWIKITYAQDVKML